MEQAKQVDCGKGLMFMEAKPILVSEADADLFNANDTTSLLAALADAVPAIIAYVDRDLRYRFVNKTYTRWWMQSRSEIVDHTVKSILGKAFETTEEHLYAALDH